MNASVKDIGERGAKRPEKTGAAQVAEPGKVPDLASFSDDELVVLATDAQAELTARRERRRSEFLENIREQARVLGIDPSEVAAALGRKGKRTSSDKRAAVAAKYRNPANHAETWAGRGAKPQWVRAALEAGTSLDDFKIPTT